MIRSPRNSEGADLIQYLCMASDSSDFVLLIKLVLEYLNKLIFHRCLRLMLLPVPLS
jgi:hypothetical protein